MIGKIARNLTLPGTTRWSRCKYDSTIEWVVWYDETFGTPHRLICILKCSIDDNIHWTESLESVVNCSGHVGTNNDFTVTRRLFFDCSRVRTRFFRLINLATPLFSSPLNFFDAFEKRKKICEGKFLIFAVFSPVYGVVEVLN